MKKKETQNLSVIKKAERILKGFIFIKSYYDLMNNFDDKNSKLKDFDFTP